MTVDDLLLSTADRILSDTCTFDSIEEAEREGWAPAAADALDQAGLTLLGVPEAAGGSGGTTADALAVLRLAGRYAAPVPLAENGLLSGWLLARAGLRAAEGWTSLVPGTPADTLRFDGSTLSGTAHEVPWARRVDRLVTLVDDHGVTKVGVFDPAAAKIEAGTNLAGEPRDLVHFDAKPIELARVDVDGAGLELRGALTRVVLMAGALERMCQLTVGYAAERQQFGRPIARFQLVQAHLVRLAQDAALLGLAADAATRAASTADAAFEIAAARALACSTATSATRTAHQAHGAMGMTRAYELHHFSRRLWSWRREFGQEHRWRLEVGAHAVAAGADGLYPLITR